MQKRFLIWNNHRDAVITLTLLLLAIGCINVYSASFVKAADMFGDGYHYLIRYIVYALIGFLVMLGLSRINYHIWLRRQTLTVIYILVLALLVAVDVAGVTVNGSRRWLYIGSFGLQPSELAKLTAIMLCAYELGHRLKKRLQASLFSYPGVRPFFLALPFALLIYLQPDMGTAAIVMALPFFMYIIAGLPWLQFLTAVLPGASIAGILMIDAPYRFDRIKVWLNPWNDPMGDGYQIVQSLISIGSGGLTGLPWGHGTGKFFYLPEAHTDFAFAIFCQEWGFIGAMILITLFVLLGAALVRMANACRDEEGFLLICGITLLVVGQAFANMLMVCGLLPVIGVPLSFISYGGTSMVLSLAALGLVLSVYNEEVKRENREELLRQAGMPPIMPTTALHSRGWRK